MYRCRNCRKAINRRLALYDVLLLFAIGTMLIGEIVFNRILHSGTNLHKTTAHVLSHLYGTLRARLGQHWPGLRGL